MSDENIEVLEGLSGREQQSSESVDLRRKIKDARLDDSKYLLENEITALFRAIDSKRDRAIFRLAYHHGLRAHEIGMLQLRDFRDRDGVLFIYRGKGSISREHSLIDNELRALRAWIKERGTTPGPLFPSRQGSKGISRFQLDKLMKKYCKFAGIRADKAHMHALKHSCGTHLAERDATPDEIQDWLGHRDSASTQVYLHFSPRRRAASVAKHKNW